MTISRHLDAVALCSALEDFERRAKEFPDRREADAVAAIGEATNAVRASMVLYGFAALNDDRLRTLEGVIWWYFLNGNPGYEHTTRLTDEEFDLLLWLSNDVAQYGECHGDKLDRLHAYGLVECVRDPAAESIWPPPSFHHAVDLTPLGGAVARGFRDTGKR